MINVDMQTSNKVSMLILLKIKNLRDKYKQGKCSAEDVNSFIDEITHGLDPDKVKAATSKDPKIKGLIKRVIRMFNSFKVGKEKTNE